MELEDLKNILEQNRYVDHPDFEDSTISERIENQDLPEDVDVSWFFNCDLPVRTSKNIVVLSREEERNVFLRYNLARKRISQVKESYPDGLTDTAKQEIMHWYKVVLAMQKKLVEYNLALVINTTKRFLKSGLDYEDMVSVGNEALLRAIKTFDISRGNKFSTYATWSIIKTFAGEIKKKQEREEKFPVSYDTEDGEDVEDLSTDYSKLIDVIRTALKDNSAGLTYQERVAVEMRYFFDGKKPTYSDVGKELGVSRPWAKHHEENGLRKLKKFLEKTDYCVAF
jgi:RNA polymerase primary sigma factor